MKLAGLTDPDSSVDSGADNPATGEHRDAAVELCLCLCELFGESLDRLTLWDRIASALATAATKVDDGNTDRFLSLCMEHVRADAGQAARHERATKLLLSLGERPLSWRQGWVRYICGHSYAVLAHGRVAWERVKGDRNGGGK